MPNSPKNAYRTLTNLEHTLPPLFVKAAEVVIENDARFHGYLILPGPKQG